MSVTKIHKNIKIPKKPIKVRRVFFQLLLSLPPHHKKVLDPSLYIDTLYCIAFCRVNDPIEVYDSTKHVL